MERETYQQIRRYTTVAGAIPEPSGLVLILTIGTLAGRRIFPLLGKKESAL